MDIEAISIKLRNKIIDPSSKKLLMSNLKGSEQEKDLLVAPNCKGFGRIKHFRRHVNQEWVVDPLPMDPVCKGLGHFRTDMIRAQVFQLAGCNFRCWYCFVPFSLINGNEKNAGWLSPSELIELYLDQPDPPPVIDLSGGHPELAPEWVSWMMKELIARKLDDKVYLWSDDNLSTDFFWQFLSEDDIELVNSYKNYSRVCCFKGFDNDSFSFNTKADSIYFDRQFEIMKRLLKQKFDIYAYATFTTNSTTGLKEKMSRFVDRLSDLDPNLPLRTVPLEIIPFTPVISRLDHDVKIAIKNQFEAIKFWKKELEIRFSSKMINKSIDNIPLGDN